MLKNTLLKISACALIVTATLTSCVQKDEWDIPPMNCENRFDQSNITLSDFKSLAPSSGYVLITEDKIFDAYVVSSDENGNFYKTISFQDKPENPTVGLQIEVDKASNYSDFPVGSHIRINAKGLRLGTDRGVVKLGSDDPNYDIGRIPSALLSKYISGVCNGSNLEIAKMTPLVLPDLNTAKQDKYVNMLVTVPNVQFADFEQGKTFVRQNPPTDTERSIVDINGYTATIRNSAFARFGSNILPSGQGNITFVVSKYNTNWQMYIRNLDDINFESQRFLECTTLTANKTLNELKSLYSYSGNDPIQIAQDFIVEGYVSSTDISGNIYKTLYIQDQLENPTQGLTIITDATNMYAKYPVGTKVIIKAKDLWLSKVGNIVQLTDKYTNPSNGLVTFGLTDQKLNTNVIKSCNQPSSSIVPLVVNDLSSITNEMVGILVKFERAQFTSQSLYNPLGGLNGWANPGSTTNREINFFAADKTNLGTIITRNSPFSNFAYSDLPTGNGTIIGIISKFNNTYQFFVRELSDVNFNGPRFSANPPKGGTDINFLGSFTEDFESYAITSSSPFLEVFPKYVNAPVEGDRYWQGRTFKGNKYIQLGANNGTGKYETYFIVPVDFTASNSIKFDVNVGYYNGDALSVYITKDYTPLGPINTSQLTNITSSFTFPTSPSNGYGTFQNAGTYNFPSNLTGNGYVLFKYTGNKNGVTTTIQLDNIVVQ